MNDGATLYQSLWAQARIELPGALDPAIELAFQNTMREFFQQSLVWQEELKVRCLNGRETYPLDNYLRHGRVQWVKSVGLDGAAMGPVANPSDCAPPKEPGVPNKYSIAQNSKITVYPEPKFDDTDPHYLCAHVALVPPPGTITAAGCGAIPADILMTWYDAILYGVMGRMMSQIAKPYTNLPVAATRLRQFKGKITEGRDIASRGSTFSPTPWRFPRFGA